MNNSDDSDLMRQLIGESQNTGEKLNKEVLDTLFSKDRDKLLMITDLSHNDIIWSTAFQAMLRFLVDDFIISAKQRNKCYKFMEDIYKMRISIDRKGRTELFDTIKAQTIIELQKDGGFWNKLKGRSML